MIVHPPPPTQSREPLRRALPAAVVGEAGSRRSRRAGCCAGTTSDYAGA